METPAFVQALIAHPKWLWAAVIGLAVLALVAKLLNWLATLFERCPHCDQAVRVGQRICHHCFQAVKPHKLPKAPSPRATRPLTGEASTRR